MARRNSRRARANRPTSLRRWTEEEDQTLLNKIGENPLNMRACFLACSEVLGRTPGACSNRWYSVLCKSDEIRHTAILTLGRSSAIRNRKRMNGNVRIFSLLRSSWDFIISLIFGSRTNVNDEQ